MSSNLPHVPYFYIIEHTPSGKRYGGSKWGKDANPTTFMVEGGYTTSSNIVNDLIESDGLGSFKTLLIVTDFGFGMSSYEYETVFLQTHDIANDGNWLNGHNNNWYSSIAFGSQEHKNIIMLKYGAENTFQVEEFKEKSRATCNIKYGADYFGESEIGKIKLKEIINKKYGVDNVFQLEETKEKSRATCLEKYNVDHHMKSKSIVIKIENIMLDKYGVKNFRQTEDGRKSTGNRFKGTLYWNDGTTNIRIRPEETPPVNFVRGRLISK